MNAERRTVSKNIQKKNTKKHLDKCKIKTAMKKTKNRDISNLICGADIARSMKSRMMPGWDIQ